MVTTARTRLHQAALAYAERGVPVFPLIPRTKNPAIKDWPNQATTDPAQIDRWWRQNPGYNLGAPTGARTGWFVLDEDPRHDGDMTRRDLEREHGRLPDTPTSLTGGGGSQYFLSDPDGQFRNTAGKLGPGLDTRGAGGFVVLPPSIHPTGTPYRWDEGARFGEVELAPVPAWLRAALTASAQRPASEHTSDDWTISEGSRDAGLASIAGKLRRQAFNEEEIGALLLVANQRRCIDKEGRPAPLPEDEVLKVARSVCRYAPSEVPDFSEAAEESARREADRLRQVMVARNTFAAEVKLPPTQKEVIKTIARFLPTLPTNDRGGVRLCAAYLKHPAGCSRGTVSTVNHILEKAGIWTLRPVNEYRDGKVEKAVYAHFADGIEPTEESFLAAVINAKIEAPQRGGARTRTITLKSVHVDDLLCPEHGDAGAVTHATTYCTAGSCGEIHAHDPVIHKAGWLSDGAPEPSALMLKLEHQDPTDTAIDAQDDGAASLDAQPLTYRKPGLLMSKLEHQGEPRDSETLGSLGDQLRDVALDPSLPPEPTCIDCRATLNVYGIKRCDPCRKRWLSEGGG